MAENLDETPTNTENSCCVLPDQDWRGAPLEEIYHYQNKYDLEHVKPIAPSADHSVLFYFPIQNSAKDPPAPYIANPKWDAYHVRLPCSAKSQYPFTLPDGSSTIKQRWEMIKTALMQPINSSHELQAAILSYNSKYEQQWNFRALHRLFNEELDVNESRVFFQDLLPRIIKLALSLPDLLQAPIPLLTQGKSNSISLTQQQISCLLANAFLCTYPRRNTLKRKSEYSTFPDINFNRLFQTTGDSVLEKIKCICHYFRRVCPTDSQDMGNVPTGVVTFTRRSLADNELPDWSQCNEQVGGASAPLHITSNGTIEDNGLGLLQVDFANKYIGGGVLGSGCVQEEIRFVICPELIVSKLFTEYLRPTEALLIVGCERFSNYTGYASTFCWNGNHIDATPLDSSRRRRTHIIAIDALSFHEPNKQYSEQSMLRELNKAYVGFVHVLPSLAPGVASGNWGCGAFGGDAYLKALLQLLVCSLTKRPLVYFTFGNVALRNDVHELVLFLIEHKVRVSDLWRTLCRFQKQQLAGTHLYNFIFSCHGEKTVMD